MSDDAERLKSGLEALIRRVVRQETESCLRCARYVVSTPPDGEKIGVRQPPDGPEIFLPYGPELASAGAGTPVYVLRYGSGGPGKAVG